MTEYTVEGSAGGVDVDHTHLVGTEAVCKLPDASPMWISDHFGVVTSLLA